MAAWCRRFTVALAVLSVSVAAWLAVDAQATDNPISITAHAGYSDIIKAQRWMPVAIAAGATKQLRI